MVDTELNNRLPDGVASGSIDTGKSFPDGGRLFVKVMHDADGFLDSELLTRVHPDGCVETKYKKRDERSDSLGIALIFVKTSGIEVNPTEKSVLLVAKKFKEIERDKSNE